ncbi:MAG: hypothetical protein ACR2RB_14180 [Gammaproteobacteria bacterium]
MKIGLFSPLHDRHTGELQHGIESIAPGASRHFTIPEDGAPKVAVDRTGVFWDDVNVARLEIAYIHRFAYRNPVVPVPLDDIDWTLWQADYIAEQQRSSFIYSAFAEMERHGVTLINPPAVHIQNFMKADLLEDLREAGFKVPTLVCTNDLAVVNAFCADRKHVLWRPATGRAPWQLFGERQKELLISSRRPPILLSDVVAGPLVRAYLYDGEPLLCLQHSAPEVAPLETLEVFRGVELPQLSDELRRLAQTMSLGWAQIQFSVWNDEEIWVYDIDPDPLFDRLPDTIRQRLTHALAHRLAGKELATEALPEEPHPRPMTFLRRMLRILFEIEYKRHHGVN